MNLLINLVTKIGARKFLLPVLAWAWVYMNPTNNIALAVAGVVSLAFIVMEGKKDAAIAIRKGLKSLTSLLILAFLATIAVPGPSQAAWAAKKDSGYPTIRKTAEMAPSPVMEPEFCTVNLEIAQVATGEVETTPEDVLKALDECQAEVRVLLRQVQDPPEIPARSWLMAIPGFNKLPPWEQVLISGTATAIVTGGILYLGTLTAPQ